MKKIKFLFFLPILFSSILFAQNLIDYDGILKIGDKKIPDGKYNLEISLLDPSRNNMVIWSEVHKDIEISTKKFSLKLGENDDELKNIFKNYEKLILQLKIDELGINNQIPISSSAMKNAIEKKKLLIVKDDEKMREYEMMTLLPRWLCPNIMIAGEAKDFIRIFIVNRENQARKVKVVLYSTSGDIIDNIRQTIPPMGRIEVFRGFKETPSAWCEIYSDGKNIYPSGYLFAEEYRVKDEKYWFEWYLNTSLKWHRIQ